LASNVFVVLHQLGVVVALAGLVFGEVNKHIYPSIDELLGFLNIAPHVAATFFTRVSTSH